MKGKLFIFVTMVSIPAAALIIGASSLSGKDNHAISTDFINIEDSLIIRSLSMESDQPELDIETGNGRIIYDDDFDDTIIKYNPASAKKHAQVKPAEGRSILAGLKKKDSRWHLVTYVIRKNDNLWKISRRFNVNHTLIISINNIKNPDMMKPGGKIKVPTKNGLYYRVKKGDTVSHISARYRVPAGKIIEANIIRPRYLSVGKKIFIPDASPRRYRKSAPSAAVVKKSRPVSARGISLSWPLRGRITSGFGTRKDPFTGKKSYHCGMDISARVGTVIKAAAKGRVIFSGWKHGYGRVVILRHARGYITVYAHNSKNSVRKGEMVKRGQKIALSGMTGAVTGAHLHFELRKYVTPLNPIRFIK